MRSDPTRIWDRRDLELEHEVARIDPPILHAGLFVQLPRGALTRPMRTLKQRWGKGGFIELHAPALGAFEQSVLLALASEALRAGERSTAPTVPGMQCKGDAHGRKTLTVQTTSRRMSEVTGCAWGSEFRDRLRQALGTLGMVQVHARSGNRWGTSQLIFQSSGDDRAITVVLCWRLAEAIAVHRSAYAAVALAERRQLGGLAQLLHALLAARISARASGRKFSVDRLARALYVGTCSPRALRKRHAAVIDAAREIATLGRWRGTSAGGGFIYFRRGPLEAAPRGGLVPKSGGIGAGGAL